MADARPIALGTNVTVSFQEDDVLRVERGVIVARTFERAPRYDVRVGIGRVVVNVPGTAIRKMEGCDGDKNMGSEALGDARNGRDTDAVRAVDLHMVGASRRGQRVPISLVGKLERNLRDLA